MPRHTLINTNQIITIIVKEGDANAKAIAVSAAARIPANSNKRTGLGIIWQFDPEKNGHLGPAK